MIEDLILVGPATEVRLSSEQNRHGRTTTKDLPTYAVHTISEFVSSVRPEQNHSLRRQISHYILHFVKCNTLRTTVRDSLSCDQA